MATADEKKTKERIEKSKKASLSSVSYIRAQHGEKDVYTLSMQVYPRTTDVQEELDKFFKTLDAATPQVTEALCVNIKDYRLKTMEGLKCLNLAVNVRTLEHLRQLCASGEIKKKLDELFPSKIDKVYISDEDYQNACKLFEATKDERDATRRDKTEDTADEETDEKQLGTAESRKRGETIQNINRQCQQFLGPVSGNNMVYNIIIHLEVKQGESKNLFQQLKDVLGSVNADCRPIRSLLDFLKRIKATLPSFRMGSVELKVQVYSETSLEQLWQLYRSGEVKRHLEVDLPIQEVYIDEEDYKTGCNYFSHRRGLKRKLASEVEELKEAASEYCQARETIVKLLNDLAEELQRQDTRRRRGKIAAGVAAGATATAGILASVLTFGASLYVAAAAVGAVSGTVALTYFVGFIIAASTIWLIREEAKTKNRA